ncbi:MAG: ATP-grasp domain-containing protein [Klebsiella michiganensis]|nr:ATP-grasp domain-containing protein [Klebsiella michiganensis]
MQGILAHIKQYRGEIEGGVVLRKVEDLKPETERRYFSFYGNVYSADDVIPAIVHEIAKHIGSPFFSIDMVETASSNLRLIEIGDGQVSDIKEWDVQKFVKMIVKASVSG